MARTNSARVKEILDHDPAINLNPFIIPANALVTFCDGEDSDGLLTDALREEIERYLAAHFYTHKDRREAMKKTGDASATFQGDTGKVLSSTDYGQTAMLLDVTGTLAKLSKDAEDGGARHASVTWLGKKADDQDDDAL